MQGQGWVYVITNKAGAGLVEVGFSPRNPNLRALELAQAGQPNPYVVEFDLFVENPREIAKRAHAHLSLFHESKEWFRCSLGQAISALQRAARTSALLQTNGNILQDAFRASRNPVTFLPIQADRMHPVGNYPGSCMHCRHGFTAKLCAPACEVICPECWHRTNISTFCTPIRMVM